MSRPRTASEQAERDELAAEESAADEHATHFAELGGVMTPDEEAAEIEVSEQDRTIGRAEDDWAIVDAEPIDLDPVRTNKMLRALGHKRQDLADFDATAADELGEMDHRHATERAELVDEITRGRAPLAQTVDHLTLRLELIGRARIAADPGAGTWTLSSGRLAVTGGGIDKVWGTDEELVAAAEKYAPDALEPRPPKVHKDKLWAAVSGWATVEKYKRQAPAREDGTVVTPDGEVVPGITVTAKDRTVTPSPNLDAFG